MIMAWIDFAPLRIPLHRRIETAAVFLFYYSFFFGAFLGTCIIVALLFTSYYPLALLYISWAYIFDSQTSSHGGRRAEFVRRLTIWKYFRDYFPIKLVRTTELDPSRNYIFGYHPHGILCAGGFCNFATEATDFTALYPGITPHLLPLMALFRPPLFRDYIMSAGMCNVTRQSCDYILTKKGPGNSIIIAVGGSAEALNARPGSFDLVLNRKKGFIKLALQTGCPLVPVFSFGENDIFKQVSNPPGSRLREIQDKIQRTLAFAPCLFYGRGIFQYTFGFLPHRKPINTVVGAPISVEKVSTPTSEQVNELHGVYVEALNKLFEDNKETYGVSKETKMTFT